MSDSQTICVGIDLGTTNSLCAVFRNGAPQLIPNALGRFLTPSVVGVLPNQEVIVGQPAVELRVTSPERTASRFKRFMGTDRKLRLAGKQFSPQELSSLVLRSLVQDAEAFLRCPVKEAVITVPAYFNDHQRRATVLAGELAGLKVRRIINEPTAAALVYGYHAPQDPKQLVVVDLGGGTFDVTVMEVFEGTLEIKSTAGESMLGGEDFTDRLVSAVLARQSLQLEIAEQKHPQLVERLRYECNQAKTRLTDDEQVTIRIPDKQGHFAAESPAVRVTRQALEQNSASLLGRIQIPLERALRDAQLTPSSIDEVLLVGGATRMPMVRALVTRLFSRTPRMDFNPDEVVALGASIQAALIQQDAAVNDLVLTDVCPFTLGVEVCKEFGGQLAAGYFQPIIHRNSTIPTSREETFCTVSANQSTILVRIFQGDARKISDNLELGTLKLEGLPPGPAGTPFYIRFTYDLNGVLEVEAYAQGGRKQRVILTNHVAGMSPKEIKAAAERMQQLKFYPREDLRLQNLIRFCERQLRECDAGQRQQLDQLLDHFEHVLAAGNREAAEQARNDLLLSLSYLGILYPEEDGQ